MFDFDGVLVDTLGLAYNINLEANPDLKLDEYTGFFNGNISKAFEEGDGVRKGHPKFHERYAEESRAIVVPEEIKILVRKLAETHILGIISGSLTSSIESVLEREGIRDCFRDVLGFDVDPSKVVRIKMLLKKYSVKPDDTVFITDTAGDVYEATECSVPAIAVTWGFQSKDTLTDAVPMAFADTVAQLDEAIEMFFSGTI